LKTIQAIGKTVEDAIANGLKELGLTDPEDAIIEVLDEGGKGVFGLFGVKMARVQISEKVPVANRAVSFLTQVASLCGVSDPGIAVAEDENGMKIRLDGPGVGALIGHRGATLDALQLLTGLVVNHHNGQAEEGYQRVTLDIGGYRREREQALAQLAQDMARRVLRSGRNVALEPMNSYERRIIHTLLTDVEGVTTYSQGEEPNRHIVIAPE
jgi:spoIIIJ-associated protein